MLLLLLIVSLAATGIMVRIIHQQYGIWQITATIGFLMTAWIAHSGIMVHTMGWLPSSLLELAARILLTMMYGIPITVVLFLAESTRIE